MKKAPETLAKRLNNSAGSMLDDINREYKDKINEIDYRVLVQSCKKIMEVTTDLMTSEICQKLT